ncbi:Meckelin [Tritrichomonas musculus]|uniref:Meckelin n=1 Tax=Tritrichomonas musculus TaxID=1915356 RepID=A0ABR2GN24_9EUKA
MLLILLIISISPAEVYSVDCHNQTLNLYTNNCINDVICNPGQTRIYNRTSNWCESRPDSSPKCYQLPSGTIECQNLQTSDKCLYSGFQDMESCQQLINDWSINYFSSSNQMNQINCPDCRFQNDFLNFIRYRRSYEIEVERNIQADFRFSSILTFILTRFDLNGKFLGFKEVRYDLNQCGEKNDISQIWRKFGTNFYSDCNFNLPVMNASNPNEFYDLYLLYQSPEGQKLEDVPVLIRNHGRNSHSDPANYELFRRFFIKFSNSTRIKYAQNITIQIQIDSSNSHRIKVPLLIIQYGLSEYNANDFPDYSDIRFNKQSSTIKDFHFSVVYLRDMSSFWKQCLIIFIIFIVIAFIMWAVRCMIYTRYHKDDGTTIPYLFASFTGYIGTALTIITFIVTFFLLFVFFKWQKQGYRCLPPESEFWYISIIVWISFFLMLISSIISLILQSRANVVIIDWEPPHEEGAPVSAWRRIMIANEYNRILSRKSYSMSITLIFLLFILEGFDLTLLSSPVPRTELIDVGKTYKVLHFGFTTFLWILIMMVQYILNFIILKKIGNPYLNFIDLCATANCSVLIMNTMSQGHYIHGRSSHAHTDVDMQTLVENMLQESRGNVGLRGLVPNSSDQVFHVYLENDFADVLRGIPTQIIQGIDRKVLQGSAMTSKTRKEVEEMSAFNSLNKCLCRFFEAEECPKTYVVQNSTLAEKIVGWGPQIEKDSVLTIQDDFSYRHSLLVGIEYTLNITYLLLFAGIEMETRSPAIAAFIVFIFDKIFMAAYSRKSRINFAKSAIIDFHYILS